MALKKDKKLDKIIQDIMKRPFIYDIIESDVILEDNKEKVIDDESFIEDETIIKE